MALAVSANRLSKPTVLWNQRRLRVVSFGAGVLRNYWRRYIPGVTPVIFLNALAKW